MTKRLIGIDFGTSTTVVHVKNYVDGKPADNDRTSVQYVDFDGQGMVPTLIQEAEGAYYFGYDAKQPKQEEIVYRNFKMDLENEDEEKRNKARELTEMFFKFLYETYEEQRIHFGTVQQEKTLVSYPAKWKRETRDFMVSCAERVGFPNVHGMDEPTAALYSVCIQETERLEALGALEPGKSSYVLMVDMGAGTTDLALCKYTAGAGAEILVTWPTTEQPLFFGGHEMDRILMDILTKYLLDNDFSEEGVVRFLKQYEEACKVWKENTISGALDQGKQVDFCFFISSIFQVMGKTPGKFPVISRESLENTAGGYLKLYAILINGMLEEARKKVNGFSGGEMIDLVILTGGHSQWYFARDILTGEVNTGIPVLMEKLKRQPERMIRLSRPQETVARGMVYTAQEIEVVSKQDSEESAKQNSKDQEKEEEKTAENSSGDKHQNSQKPSDDEGEKNISQEEAEDKEYEKWIVKDDCLDENDYRFQMALGEYLGDLHMDDDEAFVSEMLNEKKFYRADDQYIISMIMRAYGKPVITGTEKILLIYKDEGMALYSYPGYALVTTEKILFVNKGGTRCTEYLFCDICYMLHAMRNFAVGWFYEFKYVDVRHEIRCPEVGENTHRVFLCAYVRWRALNGQKPYAVSAADYYEMVKDKGEGQNGRLFNHIGQEYMISGKAKEASPEKAFQFFQKAAETGNVPALFNLAGCYARAIGCGSSWDYRRAAEYIERFVGQMTGEEELDEFYSPVGWYTVGKSIKGNMPYFIAEMFERGGFGLEPNIEKAILYYSMGRKNNECVKAEARLRAQKTFSFLKKKF